MDQAEEQRQLRRPVTLWWTIQAPSNLKMMNALNAYNSARDAVNVENDVRSRAPSARQGSPEARRHHGQRLAHARNRRERPFDTSNARSGGPSGGTSRDHPRRPVAPRPGGNRRRRADGWCYNYGRNRDSGA